MWEAKYSCKGKERRERERDEFSPSKILFFLQKVEKQKECVGIECVLKAFAQ